MRTAGILAAFAVSLAMWIIGLSWSPRIWLVIMGFGLLALVQLWRLAGRASNQGGPNSRTRLPSAGARR